MRRIYRCIIGSIPMPAGLKGAPLLQIEMAGWGIALGITASSNDTAISPTFSPAQKVHSLARSRGAQTHEIMGTTSTAVGTTNKCNAMVT
jgi:hypothetical protein